MAMTTYLKNEVLENLFQNKVFTVPRMMYIALSKTAPTDAGTGCTEPTSASYFRLGVTSNETNWTSAAEGSLSNSIALRFTEAQESWTTQAAPISHWAIFDSQTGGNMLFYGALTKTQEIPRGSILEIPENGLVTTIINQ